MREGSRNRLKPLPGGRDGPLPGYEHINRYWDDRENIRTAKILPGELYVTKDDEAIVTVLGSCVSACIRDPIFGIGGMNHFMLPLSDKDDGSNMVGNSTRYGNYAMEHLINDILKNGGMKQNLEVKIFGGGKVLASMSLLDIGRKNIAFVREYIKTEELNLLAEDVGDLFPRKVYYYPKTGRVRLKKLRTMHNQTILAREEQYMRSISSQPVAGEVELF
jgi:chemotaxis protein CheD